MFKLSDDNIFFLLLCGGNWSFYIIPLTSTCTGTYKTDLYNIDGILHVCQHCMAMVKWYHILLSLIHAIQYDIWTPKKTKKPFEQFPPQSMLLKTFVLRLCLSWMSNSHLYLNLNDDYQRNILNSVKFHQIQYLR